MGQIWRLSLSSGSFAVKEFFWGAGEETVSRETRLTGQLAAAGIRLPASVRQQDGNYLFKLPEELGGGCVRLYQWIDGVPVDGTDPDLAARIGHLLGRLHASAPPPRGEVGDWYETAPSARSWRDLAAAGLRDRQPWAEALQAHLGLLESLSGMVSPAPRERLVMCHRDVRTGNVVKDGAGNLILLDWDDAGPASADRELAQLLLDWHVHGGKIDHAAVQETLRGYRAAGGTGCVADERSFGMAVASRLNFLFEQAKAALDHDSGAVHWDFASHAAVGALRDLMTITQDLIYRLVEESQRTGRDSTL
jgi:Ser/Thr protein kinase RdoA (MazF antagonist)